MNLTTGKLVNGKLTYVHPKRYFIKVLVALIITLGFLLGISSAYASTMNVPEESVCFVIGGKIVCKFGPTPPIGPAHFNTPFDMAAAMQNIPEENACVMLPTGVWLCTRGVGYPTPIPILRYNENVEISMNTVPPEDGVGRCIYFFGRIYCVGY